MIARMEMHCILRMFWLVLRSIVSNLYWRIFQLIYHSSLCCNSWRFNFDIFSSHSDASKSNYRPPFSTEALGPGVSADVAYKQIFEKATFTKLLGSSKLADKYINQDSYLARGHLAPDEDFLFASWQYATFFYINTVPQWQAINNGNWKRLENLVRSTADFYNEDLQVRHHLFHWFSFTMKPSNISRSTLEATEFSSFQM